MRKLWKYKMTLTTTKLAGILLLSALLPVCLTISLARENDPLPHDQQHRTQSDFWDAIRMRPVKVTSVEGDTFFWEFTDTHTIEVGSYVTESRTDGKPEPGKTFIVVFCDTHKVAYRIVPLR